jgi:flagellar protein FliS
VFANPKSANAYSKIGLETGVASADPHKLIMMLFDGAVLTLADAKRSMEEKRIPDKCKQIDQALNIIDSGLRASLDPQAGGELAERLDALYGYMSHRLVIANLKNDPAILEEVTGLLNEIRTAWAEIANDPAVVSKTSSAA